MNSRIVSQSAVNVDSDSKGVRCCRNTWKMKITDVSMGNVVKIDWKQASHLEVTQSIKLADG